ncbi:unnamed protein product, partial [Protopolystoma xenopodis]
MAARPDCLAGAGLCELSLAERKAAVRSLFGRFGKTLDETGFRNQLDSQLSSLPNYLPDLVLHCFSRLEATHGSKLVRIALAFLLLTRRPLHAVELHQLLDFWLSSCQEAASVATEVASSIKKSPVFVDLSPAELNQLCMTGQWNNSGELRYLQPVTRPCIHLPSFIFQRLLSDLSPLLAGFSTDSFDLQDDGFGEAEERSHSDPKEEGSQSTAKRALSTDGWLRIRSSEISRILLFYILPSSISASADLLSLPASVKTGIHHLKPSQRLGYIHPSGTRFSGYRQTQGKRPRLGFGRSGVKEDCDEISSAAI